MPVSAPVSVVSFISGSASQLDESATAVADYKRYRQLVTMYIANIAWYIVIKC